MKYIPTLLANIVVVLLDVAFVRWVITGDGEAVTQGAIGLVLGLISLVFAWATVRLVASSAKGRLEIDVGNRVFGPGDRVDGTVTVQARRQLDAERLTVSLVATVTTRSVEKTTTTEVFRSQQDLTGPMSFGSGATAFPFTVELPASLGESSGVDLSSVLPGALSGLLSSLPSSTPDWSIEAELPVPGVDLSGRAALRTNTVAAAR